MGGARTVLKRRGPTILAIAVSVGCSLALLWPQHGRALNWDEVDYVNAARKGAATNLLDRGALSIPAYIRFARAKLAHTDPPVPAGYDENQDPFRLRHGHSPAVVVAMTPTAAARGDRLPRAVQLVGAAALIVALVVAYRLISPTPSWAGMIVILLVAPWYTWRLFESVQMHGWATVWVCLAVAFLARWLSGGRTRPWGLALCGALALLVVTLESSVVAIIGVGVCIVVWVRGLGRRAREPWLRPFVLPGLGVVLALTAVLWPGFLVRGAFLKIPAERVYQVFLGESEIYHISKPAALLSYALPVVCGVSAFFWLRRHRPGDVQRWGPALVVAAVYAASVAGVAVNDTYFLPALGPLLVLFAWMVGDLGARAQAVVVLAVAVVMLTGVVGAVRSNHADGVADRRARADMAYVGQVLGASRGLFDGGHIFRRYLPGKDIVEVSFNSADLLVRRRGRYVRVPPEEYRGTVVVLYATRDVFLDGPGGRTLSDHCPQVRRRTVVLWDCRRFTT